MRILYVEPFSGISGNMFIGALMDLGVPFSYVQATIAQLNLDGFELINERVEKCGINAEHFDVVLHHEHHNHEEEHHHEHRNLEAIEAIINGSDLASNIKSRACLVFGILAEAEAKVHGKQVNEIHFHEVGAIDTIIDIVVSVAALDYLQVDKVLVGTMQTGRGFVQCAHGLMPIPAPATAELLKTLPYYQGKLDKELVTPTGAALMSVLAEPALEQPSGLTNMQIGYGAGTWDLPIPNVVRVHLGEIIADTAMSLSVVECNLDDLSSEVYPYLLEKTLSKGALDAWVTPIIMKKGRPAHTFSLLCKTTEVATFATTLFLESSTLGVRSYRVNRTVLERESLTVHLPEGDVHIKCGKLAGQVVNFAPEFEDCRQLALSAHKPLKEIMQSAIARGREQLHG